MTIPLTLKLKHNRSRRKARQIIKSIRRYSNLPSNRLVHHIDHNPLNNNLGNLCIMSPKEHHGVHPRFTKNKWGGSKSFTTIKKELEQALILYNFNL